MTEDDYDPRRVEIRSEQFVMISGCSGSGKSTLLTELARRGFQTYAEPGRQIVKEQLHIGGDALPWTDAEKFLDLVISRAMHQMTTAARGGGLAFFDRGIVDAVTGFERMNVPLPAQYEKAVRAYRYNRRVFLSPPWPEIFRGDAERRHSFEIAVAEHAALEAGYARYAYEIVLLPKLAVVARADFVIAELGPLAERA